MGISIIRDPSLHFSPLLQFAIFPGLHDVLRTLFVHRPLSVMRLQVWVLMAVLIAHFTLFSTVVAIEENLNGLRKIKPSVLTSAVNGPVKARNLRVGGDSTPDIGEGHAKSSHEERQLLVPMKIQRSAAEVLKVVRPKLYNSIAAVAGRSVADKASKMLDDNVLLPILYKNGKRPEDFLAMARLEQDPVKKAQFEAGARYFDFWIAKNHPVWIP